MSELSDRLIILLMAATLVLGVLVGWVGGFFETASGPWSEYVVWVVLAIASLAILAGVWWGFDVVD